MFKYRFDLNADDGNSKKKLEDEVEKFKNEIILMSLTREKTDAVFKLTESLIRTLSDVIKSDVPLAETVLKNKIETHHQTLKGILENCNTVYKRRRNIERNDGFAALEENAIGFKWVQSIDEKTGNIVRMYKQNTFQFIKPSETIRTLFSNKHFEKMYFESLKNKDHVCKSGVFKDYCCGSHYQNNQMLKENPHVLFLQLYQDDFEPCEALKSKAGIHKKSAFYMIIRNMPKKLQSKLLNIYLVALANSSDIKNDSASIDSILEVIIENLKMLWTTGIEVNGIIIRAVLVTCCFDNLGANTIYGLVQSFKANYFCRFCVCHQKECKILTKEMPSKLRDIESYNEICSRIKDEGNLDFTETKGIRQYCKLNDLPFFHILENYTVYYMHDILEGMVPYALHVLFEYCFEKKIFTLSNLQNMIQFYNYGPLNKRNIPSKLRMKAKNLGQNATQLNCLILNIPFILNQYKNQLNEIWILITTTLEILEIVTSEEIHGSDLVRLESVVESHLKFIVDVLKKDLIPKHHLGSHYGKAIQTMGPTVFTSTMRFEAKHQELKTTAQNTKNKINLNKTIAEKHQMQVALKENWYCDDIEPGQVIGLFKEADEYDNFESFFQSKLDGKEVLIKSLKVNGLVFQSGLLLAHESIFFEINTILQCSNDYWFLFEVSYCVKDHDLFSNSLVLQENIESRTAISFNQLLNKNSYQKVFMQGKILIISENLNLKKLVHK